MLDNESMKRYRTRRQRLIFKFTAVVAIVVLAAAGTYALTMDKKPVASAAPGTPAARNDLRRSELKQLAAAITQYKSQFGSLPAAIPSSPTGICAATGAVCQSAHLVDLMPLASKGILNSLPSDPVGGHVFFSTGYTINRGPNGSLTLNAPRAESGAVISERVN